MFILFILNLTFSTVSETFTFRAELAPVSPTKPRFPFQIFQKDIWPEVSHSSTFPALSLLLFKFIPTSSLSFLQLATVPLCSLPYWLSLLHILPPHLAYPSLLRFFLIFFFTHTHSNYLLHIFPPNLYFTSPFHFLRICCPYFFNPAHISPFSYFPQFPLLNSTILQKT